MKIRQPHLILATLVAAALTACGGGGSGSSSMTPTAGGTDSPVTTAASNNLAALSAVPISTDAATEAFDVLASIGDTWRFVVNKTTGAYTLTPNNSQYGLAAESGTLARAVSGDFVTYALANKISLTQDTRTGALVGSMTVGGQTAQVTGTPYQVTNASKLAGTYTLMGTTQDKVGGTNPEFFAGQLAIASDGASATLCTGGLLDAGGNCTDMDPTDGHSPEKAVLTLNRDTAANGGFYKMTVMGSDNQRHDFGNLLVQNGNLGTVLLIDRYGYGDSGVSSTVRVGNFYAVKSQTWAGNELDGTWKCQVSNGAATLTVNGNANAVVNPAEMPSSWVETLAYNRVNAANGGLVAYPGFVTSVYGGSGVLVLPLSASLFVVEKQSANGVAVCTKS